MVNEAWAYNEVAKKKKIQDENKDKKKQLKKVIDNQKKKAIIRKTMETDSDLFKLKDLIEQWKLDNDTIKLAEKLDIWENITDKEVKEVFDKIDQIEDIDDIDKYLPKDIRITKDEYRRAISDDIYRVQIITKLNTALTILATQINPDSTLGLNLFSGFLTILDKNLITIQETHIDIRDSLEDLNEDIDDFNSSLWQKFTKLLKEIFN